VHSLNECGVSSCREANVGCCQHRTSVSWDGRELLQYNTVHEQIRRKIRIILEFHHQVVRVMADGTQSRRRYVEDERAMKDMTCAVVFSLRRFTEKTACCHKRHVRRAVLAFAFALAPGVE